MPAPVLIVFGAGGNVGLALLQKFKSEGFKTAAVARTARNEITAVADKVYTADLASPPETVETVFDTVIADLGTPTVVVYNAHASTVVDATDPFKGLPPQQLSKDLAVTTFSFYAVARHFSKLPPSTGRTFIYTGNRMISTLFPIVLSLGIGKSAAAYIIESAAKIYGNGDRKQRWYYADERDSNGNMVRNTNAAAHAEFYWELANQAEQGPWNATFVPGKGYVDFDSSRDRRLVPVEELLAKRNTSESSVPSH